MLKSLFRALPKKAGATECELHRAVSLMSHVTKILLRIIMMRVRNKIRPEIEEEQCGFMEGKGMSNAIFMIRTIIERTLEIQKEVYLCFIDYTIAFDRVQHMEIIKQLQKLHADGKDLRIIKNIYWEQTAAVKIENETCAFQDIKRGVRQGCVLSPELFNLYSETILRELENMPGLKKGGKVINNLRYAEDVAIIAENQKDIQNLLNVVKNESRKKGLDLNSKKTEVMVISKKTTAECNIFVDGTKLKQKQSFKYLSTLITQDGRSHSEVNTRIAQAKTVFQKTKSILTKKKYVNGHKTKSPSVLCRTYSDVWM